MIRRLLALVLLCSPHTLSAIQVLLPNVTAKAYGSSESVWSTEIRVTNLSGVERSFAVVDWIGSPGWRPKLWLVPPNATVSIGGWELFRDPWDWAPPGVPLPAFGAAIAEVDPELIVQIAVLTGIRSLLGNGARLDEKLCEPWNGGYFGQGGSFGPCGAVGPCNTGAGPVLDATDFFPPSTPFLLPWLSTDLDRRTNVVFVNPDSRAGTIVLEVFPADGHQPLTQHLQVPAHAVIQVNDVFAGPWRATRAANESRAATAARVIASSDTRLYALTYVISNLNNTVSLGQPRLLP